MPSTPSEVAAVLDCQYTILTAGFTARCPLAIQLREVSIALKMTGSKYASIPNYTW